MATTIFVVSDTHCNDWDDVHPEIKRHSAEADIAVHCGDFVRQSVVDGLTSVSKRAVMVHGNTDPIELRQSLPYVEEFDVEGVTIGVTHPAWGGAEFEPEAILGDFSKKMDVILYGHTHEPVNETRNGTLFVNPGQGYKSFMVPGTAAILTIENGVASAEIIELGASN